MQFEVAVGSHGQQSVFKPFLDAVFAQSVLPKKLTVLLYPAITFEELQAVQHLIEQYVSVHPTVDVHLLSHLTHEFLPGQGHGHDRAYLVRHLTEEFVYLIDHDNIFEQDFFEKTLYRYTRLCDRFSTACLISPTVMRGKSGEVQSRGITSFSYAFPRHGGVSGFTHPFFSEDSVLSEETWHHAYMMGANSLFGPRTLFQEIQFDATFRNCYEDLDFTRRAVVAGYPLIVINELHIYHMEPERNKLEHLLMGTAIAVYRRARNRCIFVKKTASTWQCFQYFFCGLRIQTGRFFYVLLRYGGKARGPMIWQLCRGTRHGLLRKPKNIG